MKKALALFLSVLMFTAVLVSCGEKAPVETTSTSATTTETTKASETTTETSSTPKETETQTTTTEKVVQPEKPEVKTLKILAIGNSFSVDSMEYIYQIAEELGVKEIVLGNMYIGGCSLKTHAANIAGDLSAYTFYTNTNGTWKSTAAAKVSTALAYADWDYISLQQVSGDSGDYTTYEPYLSQIIDYVKGKCPDAEIIWNRTWAYKGGVSYASFVKYDYDQLKMYNAIISAANQAVEAHGEIEFLIPTGTAIQNLRTSYLGDTLNRDDLHLSYDIGRFTAGLMWVKQITGLDIDGLSWMPDSCEKSGTLLSAIKEAVNNAYKTPDSVTPSTFTTAPDLSELLTVYGLDINNYTKLGLEITKSAYYNSTASVPGSIVSKATGSTASNLNQYITTQIFSKNDLPAGTIILLRSGCQYRPDGWISLTQKNTSATRPANVTASAVVVNDEWWGKWNFRAFNIALYGNPALDDNQMNSLSSALLILVPNDRDAEIPSLTSTKSAEILITEAGYKPENYKKLEITITKSAYYNSAASSVLVCKANGSTAGNLNQFIATQTFTKDDLPEGSLIVISGGYQYRPEGWISSGTTNTSVTRPANVTASVIEVSEDWWGNFTIRAFNLALFGNPAMNDSQMNDVAAAFTIFVPVK